MVGSSTPPMSARLSLPMLSPQRFMIMMMIMMMMMMMTTMMMIMMMMKCIQSVSYSDNKNPNWKIHLILILP